MSVLSALLTSTFLTLLMPQVAFCYSYGIDDLQILERQKDFNEYLKHAKDVPPSHRDKKWESMTINMIDHFLNDAIAKKNLTSSTLLSILNTLAWPVAKNSKNSVALAQKYSLEYLDLCLLKTPKLCNDQATLIWKGLPPQPQFGIDLARLLMKTNPDSSYWQYIKPATNSEFAQYYCNLKIVKSEVIHQFLQKFENQVDETQIAINVQKLVSTNCLRHIFPELRKIALTDNPSRFTAFWLLKSFDSIDLYEEDYLLVFNLLQGMPQGKLLNLCWAKVTEIASQPIRRTKLVQRLMRLDPIPDKVFREEKYNKLSPVLASLLEDNFPEFWPAYFKRCYEFYAGKKSFPRGNPTPSCEMASKLTKNQYLYSQKVHRVMSTIRKKHQK